MASVFMCVYLINASSYSRLNSLLSVFITTNNKIIHLWESHILLYQNKAAIADDFTVWEIKTSKYKWLIDFFIFYNGIKCQPSSKIGPSNRNIFYRMLTTKQNSNQPKIKQSIKCFVHGRRARASKRAQVLHQIERMDGYTRRPQIPKMKYNRTEYWDIKCQTSIHNTRLLYNFLLFVLFLFVVVVVVVVFSCLIFHDFGTHSASNKFINGKINKTAINCE